MVDLETYKAISLAVMDKIRGQVPNAKIQDATDINQNADVPANRNLVWSFQLLVNYEKIKEVVRQSDKMPEVIKEMVNSLVGLNTVDTISIVQPTNNRNVSMSIDLG